MKQHFLKGALLLSLFLIATPASAVSLPNGSAIFETSLASRISPTDTSMTIVTNSSGGETVNGFDCFTIDEGRSDMEYVCGIVSGTSVTGLSRGLSYANGTTTSATRAHVHRAGANVKKTDFPLLQRMRNILNGVEGVPNTLYYESHPDFSGAPGTAIPDITYVAGLVGGGVGTPLPVSIGGIGVTSLPAMVLQGNGTSPITGTSTPTVAAITATTTATSTFAGPVNNTYSGVSTSTFAGNVQVQGNASTTGSAVFNGSLRANGTTTISASNVNSNALVLNGLPTAFPSSPGTVGTTYINDGNGTLAFGKPAISQYSLASTTSATIAQNMTMNSARLSVPVSTLTASSTLQMAGSFLCDSGGSGGTCHLKLIDTAGATYFDMTFTQSGSNDCNMIYTVYMTALTINSQAGMLSGGGLCNGTYTDQSTPFTSSGNWANAVDFQVQVTTTNTSNLAAVQKGFVMTVIP